MLLIRTIIDQIVIRPAIVIHLVVMHGDQPVIRIVRAEKAQAVELVGEVLLVVRLLREIPGDIGKRRVAR